MSKYKLTKLLSEVQGGRIGTLNITAMDLERKMWDIENEGITINRFFDSPDGKTYVEYHVHPEGDYDPDESFSVYDYKFSEDPTDMDNEDKEYPFSIGGRGSALNSAKAILGSGAVAYSLDENEAVDLAIETSQEKAGIKINENSLPDGLVRALKVDGNGTKMEIEMYMKSLKQSGDKFDEVDDYVEDFKNYVADKSLQEHFGRFLKDYQ